jgi:cell wall-associated NlpC family hydrolase
MRYRGIIFFVIASFQVQATTNWQDSVLLAAFKLVGTDNTVGGQQYFTRDCSGTANAIFAEAGYPLRPYLVKVSKPDMNGVALLHAISTPIAVNDVIPGDFVFFNNTYDRNGNGKSDDVLTHVGIVTSFDKTTSEVKFVHYNTWKDKILEEHLNLKQPAVGELNIVLRWPSKNDPQQDRYAGQLIHSFGRAPS